jgi:hypothetical protein
MRQRRASRLPLRFAAIGAAFLVELVIAWSMRGFTVDDALIPARYAHHLATGAGYVFNRGGPSTDGVTPLGFAQLLVPFASGGAGQAHLAAKWLGLVATSAGAGAVAWAIARMVGGKLKWVGLVAMLASLPVAAWAGAGLETGLVVGLVAVATSLRAAGAGDRWGVALLGLASALRPELLPMSLVLGTPRGPDAQGPLALGRDHAGRAALVALPFVVVAVTRFFLFGRAAPLSSVAKAPNVTLGVMYAIACALLAGPISLAVPFGWAKAPTFVRWMGLGVLTHLAAVAFAGGDWMPLSRLVVPAIPVIALVLGELGARGPRAAVGARVALMLAGYAWVWAGQGVKAMHVEEDRAALVAGAAPALRGARVVASIDIGWVGVAAPDARVVDLAGVTDPEVAMLAGGHTSKRLPPGFLDDRGVDALVLMLAPDAVVAEPWEETAFSRFSEYAAAFGLRDPRAFRPAYVHERTPRYVVLVRYP